MNFSGRYADMIQPDKTHVLSLSVLLDNLEDTEGGVGANIAFNSALLGESPVLLGSVGPDGEDYLLKLQKVGVQTDYVHHSKLPTATFNVITDIDDNQVGGFYPGAMSDASSLSLELWAGQDVLVCASATDPATMARHADECTRLGLRLLYDPGQQVSNIDGEDLRAGIAAAELVILNDYELAVVSKKTGWSESELKTKVPVFITTLGKDGSVIEGSSVKTTLKIKAATPTTTADPSGAGDAYRAGFLYGYLRKWELAKCGQFGSVTASFVVEQHGTQVIYSKTDLAQRYQQTFNEEIEV